MLLALETQIYGDSFPPFLKRTIMGEVMPKFVDPLAACL